MRARACSEPSFGDHVQCLGDPTEVKDCSSAECPGEISHLHSSQQTINSSFSIPIQGLTPNGKNGEGGPNAQPLVARG